jgi:hypothetical protein
MVFITALLGVAAMISLAIAHARRGVVNTARVFVLAIVGFAAARALGGQIDGRAVQASSALLVCIAPPAIVIGIVRMLRATRTVTIEAVLGALCIYVLLGMFYSLVYGAIDRLDGRAFFAQAGTADTTAHFMYFSFTTLTTVGYGDLTAASNLGHTLSVSEALMGQIYLVTVVSLIVANLGRGRQA